MTPVRIVDTDDDRMLVFKCYSGTRIQYLSEMAEEAHSRLFEGS